MNTTLCVAALFLLCSVNGFKVLVYSPRFGDSHVVFMGKVADILVDEEMDVTVLLPILNSRCNSNGTKLAKTLIIDPDPRVTERFKSSFFLSQVWRSSQANPLAQKAGFDFIRDAHVEQCESNLKQKELLKFLETEEFDLGISEVFDLCGLAIFEAIGLKKHVIMQTALMPEKVGQIFGAANLPAVVPAYFSHTGNDMTYIGRIFNLCQSFISCWFTTSVGHGIEEVYTKEFGQKVDLYKKIQEASFVITNTDPLIDFPRPSSERIINIGGIGVPEPKPLNAYWEKVVTARKTTVLISFGTVAQSQLMPEEIKSTFLKTFKRFQNITFIWKYEGDLSGLAKNYTNVVTHKWVPQNDLLNHPNLKLFITHAGMNSIWKHAGEEFL
ncbi:hypothetical protein L596_026015 [Steinernema carpocapsae]|uniref:glucuronosyltransferase n=1 Tax=Steinernema carpocapsae TaxID=34508 RepID=A0A4U5M078_STECR|nr:hypothetical protein L596_026015 [Steinernema carpocapsae]